MTAKIEIYDDNGNLIDKYKTLPTKECIDYANDYEIHKYYFSFIYTKCVLPQEEANNRADTIPWTTVHDAQAVRQKMME